MLKMRGTQSVITLAGSGPLGAFLAALAAQRPVLHSEADIQQAFAWEVCPHDPFAGREDSRYTVDWIDR